MSNTYSITQQIILIYLLSYNCTVLSYNGVVETDKAEDAPQGNRFKKAFDRLCREKLSYILRERNVILEIQKFVGTVLTE